MTPNFENSPLNIEQLPKFEEVELSRPSPKYWQVIQYNWAIVFVTIAIGLGTTLYINEWLRLTTLASTILSWALLALFFRYVYRISFERRGYAIRQHDVLYKSGVIVDSTIVIPLNRIQHVAVHEGLFSRMFGLATLQLFTASGDSGDMTLRGLPAEIAYSLQESINQSVHQLTSENE